MGARIDIQEGIADLLTAQGYEGVTNRLLDGTNEGITVRRYPGAGQGDEDMDGTSHVPVNVQIVTRRLSEAQAMDEADAIRTLLYHRRIESASGGYMTAPLHIYIEPQRIRLDNSGLTSFELMVQADLTI